MQILFFSLNKSSIRLEALRNNTGFGEIIEISIKDLSKQETILSGFHNSYPFSFSYKDNEYLLPEVSNYSDQYLISMNKNHQDKFYIKGLRNKRIVDPTLIRHNDIWFLFFSEVDTANTLLELWYAKSPFDEFLEHPKSPIVISPKLARMGGRIFKKNNSLFRFGQNSSKNYGHSLSVNEIKLLNKYDYLEVNIGSIHIDNYSGPHCIDINEDTNKIIFDYYNNKFSLLAGFRRIKVKLMNHFS